MIFIFVVDQSLIRVRTLVTLWTAAGQASLSPQGGWGGGAQNFVSNVAYQLPFCKLLMLKKQKCEQESNGAFKGVALREE